MTWWQTPTTPRVTDGDADPEARAGSAHVDATRPRLTIRADPLVRGAPARLVVLVSGTGTNLQALLDAAADPAYGATVVAVGADRDGIEGLARAERAGMPTFVHRVKDFTDRADWDRALTDVGRRAPARPGHLGRLHEAGRR